MIIRKEARGMEAIKLYSRLEVKAVDEEQRVIRGIATTPTPDRAGDVVEPLGVKFKNPIPLLWQHNSREPIGTAKLLKPTEEGIQFEAKMPKVSEPGRLKDRLDEAWQSVKSGLVRGASIGFRALELSFMNDGGIHFLETEILELSLVTIPANMDATIQEIKNFDIASIKKKDMMEMGMPSPASDEDQKAFMNRCVSYMLNCSDDMTQSEASAHCSIKWDNREMPAGAAARAAPNGGAKQPGATKPKPKLKDANMTILEQITAYQNKRAANIARMDALMKKASDEAQTLDDEESLEYDDLAAQVEKIDKHLKRLFDLEKANKAAALPAVIEEPGRSFRLPDRVRDNPIISVKSNTPPGTAFTRYCMALAAAKGNRWEALARAKQYWHDQTPEVELALSIDMTSEMNSVVKAAVGTGTTTDATWASPLVAFTIMASEFIELLRPATIIGRIPGLRRVPFNIQLPRATAGTSMGWVGENAPKPVSNMAFDTVQLRWAKAAGIVVLTDELVRFSNPSAEAVVRQDMIDAMAQFLDRQFVDPTVAAITNVSPASITNGVTAITRTGTNQAAFVADVATLLNTFLTNNLSPVGGVWIMSQRQALAFSLMLNALGQPFYPNISVEGGTLLGFPVIASENVPSVGGSPSDGTPIIFAVAPQIMLADDGQVVIDASNQASVNMDSTPDSPPSGTTILVSLWQMNMTGLRAERWINWLKRRSTAVQYISNANYA